MGNKMIEFIQFGINAFVEFCHIISDVVQTIMFEIRTLFFF